MANIGRAYGRIIPPENDDDGGGFIALAIERERERDRPADVHRGCRVSTRGSCARSVAKNGSRSAISPLRNRLNRILASACCRSFLDSRQLAPLPFIRIPSMDSELTDGKFSISKRKISHERGDYSRERERENKRRRRSKTVAKRRASVP